MRRPTSIRPAAAFTALALAGLSLAGCSSTEPKLGVGGATGVYAANGKTSGAEYFSAASLGVGASPYAATGSSMPRGGGTEKVGKPYTVAGKTYYPTETPKESQVGLASWYGAAFHGRLTANGEVYDMAHLTAAHKTFPLPSYARVTNLENGRSLIVRVNDRGPFAHDRVIDLSKRAADLLDYTNSGVAKVKVEYAGRAPLHGQDDAFLLASVRGVPHDAPGRTARPVMVAANTPARSPEPAGDRGIGNVVGSGAAFLASAFGRSPFRKRPAQPVAIEPATDVATVSAYASERVASAFADDPFRAAPTTANWKSR